MTLRAFLTQPTAPHSLAAFRIGFGLLMVFSTLRFALYGWLNSLYINPTYHFTYLGFSWVQPHPFLHLQLAFTGLSALFIALGFYTRTAALLFGLSFTYFELLDKATYLNHYYLVSIFAFLIALLPHPHMWSIDALRNPTTTPSQPTTPLYTLLTLRTQITLVYFFAAIAKLHPDWLLHGQPLHMWLSTRTHLPLIGPLFHSHITALLMSWGGFLYDLTIPLLLLLKPTRTLALCLVFIFHILTWLLFPIGVFPWIMILASTLFLPPSWPADLLSKISPSLSYSPNVKQPPTTHQLPKHIALLLTLHLTAQILIPLRHHAYNGHTNWTEEGFRFSWRVMLVEKTGIVEYEVHTSNPNRVHTIYPHKELTPLQTRTMATQPDMIHQYAHHIADTMRAQGLHNPRVYAHTRTTFNTRPSQPLIDPTIDLALIPMSLKSKTFIVPLRTSEIKGEKHENTSRTFHRGTSNSRPRLHIEPPGL